MNALLAPIAAAAILTASPAFAQNIASPPRLVEPPPVPPLQTPTAPQFDSDESSGGAYGIQPYDAAPAPSDSHQLAPPSYAPYYRPQSEGIIEPPSYVLPGPDSAYGGGYQYRAGRVQVFTMAPGLVAGPYRYPVPNPYLAPAPGYIGGARLGGIHVRFPYYNYRAPWYTPGPATLNNTIIW